MNGRPLRRGGLRPYPLALIGARLSVLLQALKLLLKLLITVLQLLDVAGELPDHRLETVDARHQIRIRLLRAGGAGAKRAREKSQK